MALYTLSIYPSVHKQPISNLEKGSDQLIVTLYTLSIYLSTPLI